MQVSIYALPGIQRKKRSIKAEEILSIVAEYFNVNVKELKSRKRGKKLCIPRHLYCLIAKSETKLSLREIGELIQRDHATVIHAIKNVGNLVEIYEEEKLMLSDVMSNLAKYKREKNIS
jgi:chromosomal replication initiator protein